jgi:glutamyl-tRNA reductase
VRGVLRGELDKTLPKLNVPDTERQKLEAMCEAMANKLLHGPLTELKQSQTSQDGAALVEAVQRLFRLEASAPASEPAPAADPALATAKPSRREGHG